jgi:hypothetical protein
MRILEITKWVLVGLLLGDVSFMLLHCRAKIDILSDERWLLEYDAGYAEWFQYAKFMICASFLFRIAFRFRSSLLVIAGSLALYLFIDDFVGIHEFIGGKVWGNVLRQYGIEPAYHIGQFTFGIGLITLLLLIGRIFWVASIPAIRRVVGGFVVCLGGVAMAAVVMDFSCHIFGFDWFKSYCKLIEEGSEHVFLSLTVAWCVNSALLLLTPQPENGPHSAPTQFVSK